MVKVDAKLTIQFLLVTVTTHPSIVTFNWWWWVNIYTVKMQDWVRLEVPCLDQRHVDSSITEHRQNHYLNQSPPFKII